MASSIRIAGKWRGVYVYGKSSGPLEGKNVPFELDLHRLWFGFFWGSSQDDPAQGMPESAKIRGRYRGGSSKIWFWKLQPVGRVMQPDGTSITIREFLSRQTGKKIGYDIPQSPIRYDGQWNELELRFTGQWRMVGPDGQTLSDGEWSATKGEKS